VFRAEMVSALQSALESAFWVGWVELHLFLVVSSMAADCLWCNFGKEGIWELGLDEAWLGVFLSQASPFYAQETEYHISSLLGPRGELSCLGILFPLLQHVNTLLWPVWPCSMSGTCQTFPAVHYLLPLPS